jgi:hypothetical protein
MGHPSSHEIWPQVRMPMGPVLVPHALAQLDCAHEDSALKAAFDSQPSLFSRTHT